MKENSLPRLVLILLSTSVFVAALVVNAFAGAGRGEFRDLRATSVLVELQAS